MLKCKNGAARERFSVCWDGKAEARTSSRKIQHMLMRTAEMMSDMSDRRRYDGDEKQTAFINLTVSV